MREVRTFTRFVGGFAGNVSTGLARLGVRCAIVSRVGDEGHGEFVRDVARGRGRRRRLPRHRPGLADAADVLRGLAAGPLPDHVLPAADRAGLAALAGGLRRRGGSRRAASVCDGHRPRAIAVARDDARGDALASRHDDLRPRLAADAVGRPRRDPAARPKLSRPRTSSSATRKRSRPRRSRRPRSCSSGASAVRPSTRQARRQTCPGFPSTSSTVSVDPFTARNGVGAIPGIDSVMNCARKSRARCRSCRPQLGFCRPGSAARARIAVPYRPGSATSPELRRTRSRPPARAAI